MWVVGVAIMAGTRFFTYPQRLSTVSNRGKETCKSRILATFMSTYVNNQLGYKWQPKEHIWAAGRKGWKNDICITLIQSKYTSYFSTQIFWHDLTIGTHDSWETVDTTSIPSIPTTASYNSKSHGWFSITWHIKFWSKANGVRPSIDILKWGSHWLCQAPLVPNVACCTITPEMNNYLGPC